MELSNLLDFVRVQVCYRCLLLLLPLLQITEAIMTVTTPSNAANNQANDDDEDDDADIIKGLAAGFGFFFGMIMLVCIVWCVCCTNACNKKDKPLEKRLRSKVSPSPPHSANVRTRPAHNSSA